MTRLDERPKIAAGVIGYVTEEVSRQGHDVFALDGIERVAWMLEAWCGALRYAGRPFTLYDIKMIGCLVEREKNESGFRRVRVRVGPRICPAPRTVQKSLKELLLRYNDLTPLEFYKEFELIHPFVDGNGRTGKILLNWKNGTLFDPIFPPNDLFGEWIQNP